LFQLILDNGASEVVLTVNVDDADNLFDWLAASSDVYYASQVLGDGRSHRLLAGSSGTSSRAAGVAPAPTPRS